MPPEERRLHQTVELESLGSLLRISGCPLLHPELIEERAPQRMTLVVANAVGDEDGEARTYGRNYHGSIHECMVDLRPELIGSRRVSLLCSCGPSHLQVNPGTAKSEKLKLAEDCGRKEAQLNDR
jgi:hypothetical protein